jgi:dephospho-CoA kinase
MGAGKSTALEALQRLGAAVISSDAVVHELYAHDVGLREAVLERWGPGVVPDGVVDRAALAERVFANREEREWLEGLLWPLVAERVTQWLSEVRATRPAPRAAVVEVPLLFEAGLEGIYDATIAVVAEEQLRRERAAGRGHALASERDARQLAQSEKAERATYTVTNDGDESELQERLEAILCDLGDHAP